ncbi:MAG: PKD domain-containing protein [Planctomycetes bacterium]|nr:PKD domain-containing protein [Planctomycetota bacterium]
MNKSPAQDPPVARLGPGLGMCSRRRAICVAALLLLAPALRADDWWNAEWPLRRRITTQPVEPGHRAGKTAFAEVNLLGRGKADGSDLRVVASSGRVVPHALVSAGKDDLAQIAFPAAAPGEVYHVYFGNPSASAPEASYLPDAGLVLEVRDRGPGVPTSWAEMQRILEGSPTILGRGLYPEIRLAFNPFGRPSSYILRFTGILLAPADGEYAFALNSWDASFLLVDGKVVAEWPGWHNAVGGEWGGHAGKVRLSRGPHPIECVNAIRGADQGLVAGWQPPGRESLTPIPPRAFLAGLPTRVDPVEELGKSLCADTSWRIASDLGIEGVNLTEIHFRGDSRGDAFGHYWDFGDGQISIESGPVHIYLESGLYSVKHQVTSPDGETSVSIQRILVQPYGGRPPSESGRILDEYGRIVSGYRIESLAPVAAFRLGTVLYETARYDLAADAILHAAKTGVSYDDPDVADYVSRAVVLFRDRKMDYTSALLLCDSLATQTPQLARAAEGKVRAAEIHLECLGDIAKAESLLSEVLAAPRGLNARQIGRVRARLAEIHIARGEKDKARALLAEIDAFLDRDRTAPAEIQRGVHTASFENYLAREEYLMAEESLDLWVEECPLERLTGYPRYLQGRLLVTQGFDRAAARDLRRMADLFPEANHAPAALLLAGDSLARAGEKEEARGCYERIAKAYPLSAESEKAAQRLAELGAR